MVNRNSKSKAQKKKAPAPAPATRRVVPQPTNVDITLQWTHLPEWANAFIPSLTQALYTSHQPFSDFKRDSDGFLTTIQHVFDESFPHIQYSFESSDALVGEACKCLNTRQSKIASDVLEQVKHLFNQKNFVDKPENIKDYAEWALKSDGPTYYLGPTPRDCTARRGDPEYIKPTSTFQSTFIINVAQKYLCYAEKSVLSPKINPSNNPPVGLWGMLLLSAERAFTAYLATGIYVRQIAKLGRGTSSEILHAAHGEDDCNTKVVESSTISAFRENLYIPSSPEKPY
ncbi:hypothetical protein BYT27DRAFT_7213772 [Phlegmacium glaucopus]|nr:hypothetical protein BYT27DRAFT_7213772 [Phlegmacium glaucopus]